LATANTDASGTFIFHWTPDITGNYTVTAAFSGSGGYYGSYDETGFYVSAPPTAAPTASPLNEATTQNYELGLGIAAIIVIIIGIAVLAMLMVRRRV
jgi:hypothetical protein